MTLAPRRRDAAGDVLTSSFCSSGGCVGVRFTGDAVAVEDTKIESASLTFSHDEWAAFVHGVKNGEFDLP